MSPRDSGRLDGEPGLVLLQSDHLYPCVGPCRLVFSQKLELHHGLFFVFWKPSDFALIKRYHVNLGREFSAYSQFPHVF